MKFISKIKLFMILLSAILVAGSASAASTSIYAVSVDNTNIYEINVTTGAIAIVSNSLYKSVSLACDGTNAYYWNSEGNHRGLMKWNPLGSTNTLVNANEISEENACFDSSGNLWVLDRTNSYVDGAFLGKTADNTFHLYQIDKTNGTRTVSYTLPDVGGYATGDIAWGPDGKLYISTNNVFWTYDTASNYVWDPADPTNIATKGGVYHAGLVWVDGKLYGSKTNDTNGTGAIYELNPTDFSEIALVATMSTGVTIGDLSNSVPEPATICLLGLASMALMKRQRR